MSSTPKLGADSFVGLVKQSGLVDADLLKRTVKAIKERGGPLDTAAIADEFVARNLLTRWQADMLLRGKHKGFFLGKYRLLSHLGSGGMSSVYLAEHILMRRRVAIKVLPKSRVNDSSYLERFHREAQAVAALDHRNIVRAYDVDQENDRHFLVMEFVPGQSLHEMVARHGPLEFVAAAEYMRQAAEGLQHAHKMGMVHRDIKPGNLLLDEKGTVKLLDLGLARFFDEKEESSLTVKHDEKVLGTADYLSPEQALDSHAVDIRSDIYSLGCTFYFLLAGHPPFPEGTLAQRLIAHQTREPRRIAEERTDIPAALAAIIEKMMAKKPDDRYQTARDASQALLDWLSENGGATWADMNPVGGRSSQVLAGPPGSSASNLDAAAARPAVDPDQTRVSEAAASAFSDLSPAATARFDEPPATTFSTGQRETEPDRELAAFFSHLAAEESTKISRPGRVAAQEVERPAPAETAPAEPMFEATITMPPASSEPELFAEAPAESAWPTVEPVSFEPAPAEAGDECPPTVVRPAGQQHAEPAAVPVLAAEAPAPPGRIESAAPRVARPVAGQKPPIAKPVAGVPVAKPVAAAAEGRPSRRLLVIGGSSAAAILLAAVGVYFFANRPASDKPDDAGKEQVKKTAGTGKSGKGKKKAADSEKVAAFHGEFTVGPAGQFRTIGAALAELRQYANNKSHKAIQTVKVTGGVPYPERIVIDEHYPRGIHFVAQPGPPVVLSPPGPEPIVTVRASKGRVEYFHLEGFQLDASGKETAVDIAEWVPGLALKQLEISGFTRTGVHFSGAQTFTKEQDRIVAERLTFRNAAPAAVAVLINRGEHDPGYIRINQCRFLGPLDAGVRLEQLETGAAGIEISECLFDRTATGVRLEGEDRIWKDLIFAANTFYENDRAIVFTNMPGPHSLDLGFYNNLFVGSKTSDVTIEKDLKLKEFLAMFRTTPSGAANNWTTRPLADSPRPEELLSLFEAFGGKRTGIEALHLASTDPASPDFLAPTRESPHRQVNSLWEPKRIGTQVGAVRPK